MTKIDQIKRALLELEGGKFQNLADAYLYKKGYEWINSPGSVPGTDKVRKGTPDTFFSLPNGNYALVEYTTQQTGVYSKIEDDLSKCFGVMKTGVPVEEMIFCHTSTLSATEVHNLAVKCQMYGVNINIFGLDKISQDLYQKYPGLAWDFLGVEVDTGQIMPPGDFIITYGKSKLATRLNTNFHFREIEVEQVIKDLENAALVFVSGGAGVGKSRFALECCMRFKDEHPEYEVQCIYNRGLDLSKDLCVHFSEPGNFLILVDDANRISRFDYFIQLLQDQREDQLIKVIVTVRDYAIDKVLESASPQGEVHVMELQLLDDNQIKQLVKEEYGILNPIYLDRIAYIAKGNPRIAIMAAEVASQEETLESIRDATALYDKYFALIKRDLEVLGDKNILRTAGIIAFFRNVDRSNKEMIDAVTEAFEMPLETFWEAATLLHSLEILDMHGNEVVKISDQVLATYLFYLAFFKDKVLKFSVLLDHFFPKYSHRLIDSINPILNTFDIDSIEEAMRLHVNETWASMEKSKDEGSLLHLVTVFRFIEPTKALLYVKNRIDRMEEKSVDLSKIEFKANSQVQSPSLLSVLASFKNENIDNFRMALDLLLNYLSKQPGEVPQVLHILTEKFGFEHQSYGFVVQKTVIDFLWDRTQDGEDELYSKLFLAVAEQYLHTHFRTYELKGAHAYNLIDFHLNSSPELLKLRRSIWDGIFRLYQKTALKDSVIEVFHNYIKSSYRESAKDIVSQDSTEVLTFIASELEPAGYRRCSLVQDYLDLLYDCEVPFDQGLRDRFSDELYKLSQVLLIDWLEKRDMDPEECKPLRKQQIETHFYCFGLAEYEHFFEQCLEIHADLGKDNKGYQLRLGIEDVVCTLADRDPLLYVTVLEYYLELGDPLYLNSLPLIRRLIEVCGAKRAYEILYKHNHSAKREFLFSYYRSLPPVEATGERLEQLYALYQDSQVEELTRDIDFLLKYRQFDAEVVLRVTEIILEKEKADCNFAYALTRLFNPHSDVNKEIMELFANDLDLLKQAYFAVLRAEEYMDYDGKTFNRILDLEPDFVLEYIDQMYEKEEILHSQDDTRDYTFLWMRDDYDKQMTKVVGRIYEQEFEQTTIWNTYTYLETFFVPRGDGEKNLKIEERQDRFVKGLIESRHSDLQFMKFIFSVIAHFPPERRLLFVTLFLKLNTTFEIFQELPLEPNIRSWSGSAVSMYQKQSDYLESIVLLLNKVDLLPHRQYVEEQIQLISSQIEWEKKRDFMEGYVSKS